MTPRRVAGLVVLGVLAVIVVIVRFTVDHPPGGSVGFAWPDPDWAGLRLTAIAGAVIVGVGLATAGVMLQVLLRNPLASPFLLGLSSGSGLGIMIALVLAHAAGTALTPSAQTVPAALGGLATLLLVYTLGQRGGWLDPVTLVLVGVVVATMCGAVILFLHHLVPTAVRGELTTWMMGRVPETASLGLLIPTGVVVALGLVLAQRLARAMDAALLGDDEATSVGLDVKRLHVALFLASGVITAATVTIAGPIGFVGLIAPHAARLVTGPRHAALVPGAALCGVIIVVGSDAARQFITMGSGRLPIGVFTALGGGVVFLWLLRRRGGWGGAW